MKVYLQDIIYSLPQPPSPLSFFELFGNDRRVELEIGTGKGGFLLEEARAHADRNYLGIERAGKYFLYAADRFSRWQLANVRILRADGKDFVMHYVPEASLAALHVYHPDPWPKRRHHKRRLFDAPFVQAAASALKDGATWWIQTDHKEYLDVIRSLLDHHPDLAPVADTALAEQVETNYQVKYKREGRPSYRLGYVRRPRMIAECGLRNAE